MMKSGQVSATSNNAFFNAKRQAIKAPSEDACRQQEARRKVEEYHYLKSLGLSEVDLR
ncbi:hypothetical protein L4C31_01850 [Aliivibrio sifiae]